MRRELVVLAPCLLGILDLMTIGGCANTPNAPTILEARTQPYVTDVPVPKDFTLGRKSEHASTAGHRSIKHIYQGKARLLAVRNFYLHNMPLAEWTLLDEKLQNGVYLLNFQKGRERCEIRIERVPHGWFGEVTHIRATLRPTNRETSAPDA